jgi:hypothetical protein
MEEHTHLLQFFGSNFILCHGLFIFPCGNKLLPFKALESWVRNFIVTNCKDIVYAWTILTKQVKASRMMISIYHYYFLLFVLGFALKFFYNYCMSTTIC